MGIFEAVTVPLAQQVSQRGLGVVIAAGFAAFLVVSVILNVLSQILFKNPNEPPIVFHFFPIIGSTVTYGIDPYKFFFDNKAKYGEVFTFILLGKKTTVYLGTHGNEFILNGKIKDVNAEEVYTVLTTPVFGKDVVYDCPNSKLMEQKKFMKIGLTTEAFKTYVPIIQDEVETFIKGSAAFKGHKGTVNIPAQMAEITIYTASHALQGKDCRDKFDHSFAELYHALDMGFSPINFMLHWAPLPHNRARDHAQRTVAKAYMGIMEARRKDKKSLDNMDIMSQLMRSTYKNGVPVPDMEIAHMMIALLMAGQHSSSSSSTWIILRLAARPDILEELYQEQLEVLGSDLPALQYEDLAKLTKHQNVLKEVLRLHTPIHSIMRKVKSPMPIAGTKFVIPTSHVLLASPGFSSREATYFPDPLKWEPHRWDPESGGVLGTEVEEESYDYGYGLISKGAKSPYLPFGAGRHRCIGEQFANVQLITITAVMVRYFKFRNLDGSSRVVETDYTSLFSRPLAPAVVEWEKREKVKV
ncbi:probable cytochrome P450 51 (eburicol 14 alpha-demethylase) [Rhynchosporium agropyri]|uniref:CYP51B n=1 Tax=Rhynchosporium agropyri TaxID=914238 RepID=A0A075MK41_9HELO|nr:CYP51B [Rhynchosporium agropyri]CZS94525.1 probable cytochrome P450 51 (eburicol 14 alpha-demethylase) [Rhynchosporium agropyri]